MPLFFRRFTLVLVLLGVGMLRTLLPVSGMSPAWSHPLSLALLLLFVVWVAGRSDGHSLPWAPVLAALILEGWVRLALFNPGFERWLAPHLPGRLADSVYHLLGALWLAIVVILFASPAGVRMRFALAPGGWRSGLYLHTLSVLFVYGALALILQAVEGFRGLALKVPIFAGQSLWVLAGQVGLCLGEELFYRGFLFAALAWIFAPPAAATPRREILALCVSSGLFALDHLRGMPWGWPMLMTGVYTLGLGALLTALYRLSGHIALPTLAHLFHNLMILRLGLTLTDPSGLVGYEAATYISIYFIGTFALLFLLRRPEGAPLRRALAVAA